MKIIDVVFLTIKLIVSVWAGYKFLTEDKDKISTLWYGMFLITLLI